MPIDLDIRDEVMVERMLGELHDIAPEAATLAPLRTGKFPKLMVFCRWQASTRYPDKFTRIASDKFFDEAGVGHVVEVFGGALTRTGNSSKQVGAFGAHSEAIDYTWDDVSLLDVPLKALPVMTQEQAWELLKRFEERSLERGWRRQEAPQTASGQFIYDITEASRFNVQNGPDGLTYDELCAHDIPCRVDGGFIDGSTHRRDKCLVDFCNKAQVVGVYDTEGGAWHLPIEAKPPSTRNKIRHFKRHDKAPNGCGTCSATSHRRRRRAGRLTRQPRRSRSRPPGCSTPTPTARSTTPWSTPRTKHQLPDGAEVVPDAVPALAPGERGPERRQAHRGRPPAPGDLPRA